MKNKIKVTFLLKLLISIIAVSFLVGLIALFFRENIFYSPKGLAIIGSIVIVFWFLIDSGIISNLILVYIWKRVKIETIRRKKWFSLFFKEVDGE